MRTPIPEPAAQAQAHLRRDLRTLVEFIEIFCKGQHAAAARSPVALKSHDVPGIVGHEVALCPDCVKLLTHALVKRSACPMNPKPACKHCPNHCYHPTYRRQIRQVMQYSGKRLILTHPIQGLLRYFF